MLGKPVPCGRAGIVGAVALIAFLFGVLSATRAIESAAGPVTGATAVVCMLRRIAGRSKRHCVILRRRDGFASATSHRSCFDLGRAASTYAPDAVGCADGPWGHAPSLR